MAEFYFGLAILSALGTLTAVVQARRLYWLVPVYFLSAWLTGELAFIHLVLQLGLTSVLAFAGVFSDPLAQCGLGIFGLSWIGLLYLHAQAQNTGEHVQSALYRALGRDYRSELPVQRREVLNDNIVARSWLQPFNYPREGVRVHSHISYGEAGKRNLLDIYQPVTPREGGSPILLQVHGGAWIIGSKEEQAKPLMYHMSQRGWICVAINYRLSPQAAFPAHIIDVKKAIAWIKDNIAEYGGDPNFIAITGGSAGGHLSSLAALTPNRAQWQPGFEEVDTTLQAAVPFYGVYDFLDRYNIRTGMSMDGMIADKVMQCSKEGNRELWDECSPLSHVSAEAPPMYVIQGSHDSLVWVEEARVFVSALQSVSLNPVAYAELPGAQHAFEIFHSVRTDEVVNSVADFLEWSHANWLAPQ
ncbi:MAG: acetyl esterase/lipase [Halioglobus sp.]|jgi:acetyl esterase/lipase